MQLQWDNSSNIHHTCIQPVVVKRVCCRQKNQYDSPVWLPPSLCSCRCNKIIIKAYVSLLFFVLTTCAKCPVPNIVATFFQRKKFASIDVHSMMFAVFVVIRTTERRKLVWGGRWRSEMILMTQEHTCLVWGSLLFLSKGSSFSEWDWIHFLSVCLSDLQATNSFEHYSLSDKAMDYRILLMDEDQDRMYVGSKDNVLSMDINNITHGTLTVSRQHVLSLSWQTNQISPHFTQLQSVVFMQTIVRPPRSDPFRKVVKEP